MHAFVGADSDHRDWEWRGVNLARAHSDCVEGDTSGSPMLAIWRDAQKEILARRQGGGIDEPPAEQNPDRANHAHIANENIEPEKLKAARRLWLEAAGELRR